MGSRVRAVVRPASAQGGRDTEVTMSGEGTARDWLGDGLVAPSEPYEPPAVVVLGSIEELTRGSTGATLDIG